MIMKQLLNILAFAYCFGLIINANPTYIGPAPSDIVFLFYFFLLLLFCPLPTLLPISNYKQFF